MIGPALLAATTLAAVNLPSEAELVALVKALPVKKIDERLGNEPFEVWLGRALGPHGRIDWMADDCGESEGAGNSVPVCVSIEARLRPRGVAMLSVAIGTSDRGIGGKPTLFFGGIAGLGPTEVIGSDQLHLLPEKVRSAREVGASLAQLPDVPLDEKAMTRTVEELPAAFFAPGLPNTSLGAWVATLGGAGAQLTWSVNGCGRRGPPVNLTGTRDEWAFVRADLVEPQAQASISIRAGTCRHGLVGKPVVASVSIYDKRRHRIDTLPLNTLSAALAATRR